MPILTAIDNEPGSETIVSAGAELASGLDEELVVLHAIPEGQDAEDPRRAVESTVEAILDDPDSATVTVQHGDPAVRILRKAENLDADYVVVGTRKRSPVGKVLFGSVAQLVLLNSDTPVVSVAQIEQ